MGQAMLKCFRYKICKYRKEWCDILCEKGLPLNFPCIGYKFDQSEPMGCNFSIYFRTWIFLRNIFVNDQTKTLPQTWKTIIRQDIKHVKVGRSCLISIYLLKIKQLLYLCNRNIYILLYSRTTLFVACFVDRMILMVRIVKKYIVALDRCVLTLRIQMHLINFIFKHIKYKAL